MLLAVLADALNNTTFVILHLFYFYIYAGVVFDIFLHSMLNVLLFFYLILTALLRGT